MVWPRNDALIPDRVQGQSISKSAKCLASMPDLFLNVESTAQKFLGKKQLLRSHELVRP